MTEIDSALAGIRTTVQALRDENATLKAQLETIRTELIAIVTLTQAVPTAGTMEGRSDNV